MITCGSAFESDIKCSCTCNAYRVFNKHIRIVNIHRKRFNRRCIQIRICCRYLFPHFNLNIMIYRLCFIINRYHNRIAVFIINRVTVFIGLLCKYRLIIFIQFLLIYLITVFVKSRYAFRYGSLLYGYLTPRIIGIFYNNDFFVGCRRIYKCISMLRVKRSTWRIGIFYFYLFRLYVECLFVNHISECVYYIIYFVSVYVFILIGTVHFGNKCNIYFIGVA